MTKITLAESDAVIDGVFAAAGVGGMKPLAVVVLDDGGIVVSYKRQDGSPILRFE
ncbi:MAG: heme-binding protein, partial [Rhodospirillaceae bacterium]|nr:heme-binding protein [Rhodospirillaceae bacterium]